MSVEWNLVIDFREKPPRHNLSVGLNLPLEDSEYFHLDTRHRRRARQSEFPRKRCFSKKREKAKALPQRQFL